MRISVVIPVYNAAAFIHDAVASALQQPETGEVLLVEDGSTDDSLNACRELAKCHPAIKLLQHADGGNHGAAASRNLGIAAARHEFIAFLDADDYYLPGRFGAAVRIFTADPGVDGVYDAIGTVHADARVSEWYRDQQHPELLTVAAPVPDEMLFETLVSDDGGFFCTDGIVVRSELLRRAGGFDASLRMGEDTALWIRLSVLGRLVAGCLDKPVGLRRLHGGNTIYRSRDENALYAVQMAKSLLAWGREVELPRHRMVLLTDWLLNFQMPRATDAPYAWRKCRELSFYARFVLRNRLALRSRHYWDVVGATLGMHRLLRRGKPTNHDRSGRGVHLAQTSGQS